MYINFWYPVAQCHELTNEAPLRVRILSLDFVAFRDSEGNAHVLSDTCIHRGGAYLHSPRRGAGRGQDRRRLRTVPVSRLAVRR
jgi:phenylpropionate dioxygenase-like ring-hydroxylating dioxygenase large terminal subunit